jgi:hypothetical protein
VDSAFAAQIVLAVLLAAALSQRQPAERQDP